MVSNLIIHCHYTTLFPVKQLLTLLVYRQHFLETSIFYASYLIFHIHWVQVTLATIETSLGLCKGVELIKLHPHISVKL